MLYHNNGGKIWWVMFRDPRRKGKFIRKSTGVEDYAKARQIEQATALAVKGKLEQRTMEGILEAVYGIERAHDGMPLAVAFGEYEKVIRQQGRERKQKTVSIIRTSFENFVKWAEKKGVAHVKGVTSQVALEYAEKLRRSGLKDKTRKNYLSALSSVWRVLGGIENGVGNPWTNYLPAVKDSVRHGAFTPEDERKILEVARKCKDPTWVVLCLIARHTGLRKGDVVHMKMKQVDLKAGVIRMTPSKTERFGIAVNIPMVAELKAEMEKWMRTREGVEGLAPKYREYLFPEFVKAYPNDPIITFKEILGMAKIKDKTLSFHSYRHTFRTRLAESGAPDELAKRLGGWTQDKTLARYDHAEKTEEIRAMIEKAAGGGKRK